MFEKWKGLQLSSGQTPDLLQDFESSCPGPSSPTPSCPALLQCGISPLWLLSSSCPRVSLGGLAHLSAWVSLGRLPPPAMLLEVPGCVSLTGEFGGAGFILLSPGLGTGRCSIAFIQLMGGGLGQPHLARCVCQPHPKLICLCQGRGGNSHKSESSLNLSTCDPARGESRSKKPPG